MSLRLSSNHTSDSITLQDTKFELTPQYNDSNLLSFLHLSGSESHPSLLYKWSRIRNEKPFQVKDQTSNTYITTCDDIDSFIQVDFSCDSFSGSCKIGPLRLERSVRKSLEYIMNKGSATFPLSCTGDLDYNNASDLVLDVSQEMLKLTTYARDGSKDERNSFESSFSVTYPRITLHASDSQQLCFEMNDGKSDGDLKFSRKLLVSCLNQQTRDLILMSIRVFALKNSVKVDRALEFYLNDVAKCKTDLYIEKSLVLQELYELFDENQSLKKQLFDQTSLQKTHTSQISSLKSKVLELELALQTRNTTEEDSNTEKLKFKVEKLSEEKGALKEKHKTMQKELNELKMKIDQKDLQSPQESSKNNEALSQELEILKAKNKTLSEKVKRQKSALISFENENKDIKLKMLNLQEQLTNYNNLLNENKELIKRITRNNDVTKSKDMEIEELKEKIVEMTARHEKSNNSLVQEINRLADEMENCKKCVKLQESLNKSKEDVAFYRNQCDTMSANLSRAQAQIRKGSCSRRG